MGSQSPVVIADLSSWIHSTEDSPLIQPRSTQRSLGRHEFNQRRKCLGKLRKHVEFQQKKSGLRAPGADGDHVVHHGAEETESKNKVFNEAPA